MYRIITLIPPPTSGFSLAYTAKGCDARRLRLSPLILAHQLPLSKDVSLHGFEQIGLLCSVRQFQHGIEGINLEVVPVSTARRTRSAIA